MVVCTCALPVWYLLDLASWSEARGALLSRETTRVLGDEGGYKGRLEVTLAAGLR